MSPPLYTVDLSVSLSSTAASSSAAFSVFPTESDGGGIPVCIIFVLLICYYHLFLFTAIIGGLGVVTGILGLLLIGLFLIIAAVGIYSVKLRKHKAHKATAGNLNLLSKCLSN